MPSMYSNTQFKAPVGSNGNEHYTKESLKRKKFNTGYGFGITEPLILERMIE
jgi:hypothetical protein